MVVWRPDRAKADEGRGRPWRCELEVDPPGRRRRRVVEEAPEDVLGLAREERLGGVGVNVEDTLSRMLLRASGGGRKDMVYRRRGKKLNGFQRLETAQHCNTTVNPAVAAPRAARDGGRSTIHTFRPIPSLSSSLLSSVRIGIGLHTRNLNSLVPRPPRGKYKVWAAPPRPLRPSH